MLCIREAENLAGIFKMRLPNYKETKFIKIAGLTRGTPSYKLRWDLDGIGYVAEIFTDITGQAKLRFTRKELSGEVNSHYIRLEWDDLINLDMAENFASYPERKREAAGG